MSVRPDGFDDYGWPKTDRDPRDLSDLPPDVAARVLRLVEESRTPLGPDDPRRHHFIPQFFLKRFATSSERVAIVRLDRPGRPNVTSVTNAAVMKDLYTVIDEEVGESASIEKLLALADDDACGAIARLAGGFFFPPQAKDRGSIAFWIALLNVRDPGSRRRLEAMADSAIKMQLSLVRDEQSARAHLEAHGDGATDADIADLLEFVAQLDQIEFIPSQNELVQLMLRAACGTTPLFLRRNWSILRFAEDGLVLSDRPLVLFQEPGKRSPFTGVGLGNADELWLALDRRTALVLHFDDQIGERILEVPLAAVRDFNQAAVIQAFSEVYCHPDDLGSVAGLELPTPGGPLMRASGADWFKATTDGVNGSPRRRRHHRYRREEG